MISVVRSEVLLSAALAIATWLVYAEVTGFAFVSLDDTVYVSGNPAVRSGLNLASVREAFTGYFPGFWNPLTLLSLMVDVELFGIDAGAVHRTNLALHVANTVLLFLLFARLTRAPLPSALIAALFALHPLHVESVAWIAERKDVLSTLFWLGCTATYARYARSGSRAAWLAAPALMALGLLAKPMLVTLPLALLLLDVWPLRRLTWSESLDPRKLAPLLREKLPLFALTVLGCVLTLGGQTTAALHQISLAQRLANSAVAYVRYLGKTLWPRDLAIFYPYPGEWALWQVAGSVALLGLLSLVAFALRRRAPYVLGGWLFFLGVLVPTIGLVQVGDQSLADRYMYLPLIGLAWIGAFGAEDLARGRPAAARALIAVALLVCGALGFATQRQVAHWRDSATLFAHALAVTDRNYRAHELYADALFKEGDFEAAANHLREALRIRPAHYPAYELLGAIELERENTSAAISHLDRALALGGESWFASMKLGEAYEQRGELARATRHYRASTEQSPFATSARNRLGRVLAKQGRLDEARAVFEETMRRDPTHPEAWESLGIASEMAGDRRAAAAAYRGALERQPRFLYARRRLGWILATAPEDDLRDGAEAVVHLELACEQTQYRDVADVEGLAAAYAESGRFDDAARTARRAATLARSSGDAATALRIESNARSYERGAPLRLP